MPDDVRTSYLDWLATEDKNRQQQYKKYREYYDGEHGTQLTARQRRYLQIKDGQEFNVNLCAVVVDALAERLKVTGFVADEDQAAQFWEWWTDNRMDGVQNDAHTAGVRDGDTYVIVEWDNEEERPTFCHELAYDGTDGVKIHYASDRRGVPVFASKRWLIGSENGAEAGYKRRLNLYYPDRIEKYVSDQREYEGNWQRYQEEGESWPLWWTRTLAESGEALGLPVAHFKNQGRGFNYGRSELVDAIPVQNALNKSVIDLLAAADVAGFGMLYMLGDDPSGLTITPGAILYSEKPPSEVNIGNISPTDLKPMSDTVDGFKMTMAQVTRTPVSHFQISGHRPAEGTLRQEESGLVAKAGDRQVYFGNAWENVMLMARKLHNVFGPGKLNEEVPISTLWNDPQTRNEKELMETLRIEREALRTPLQVLWGKAGYSPEEIEQMQSTEEYQTRMSLSRLALGPAEAE
jgi:hypothetical protein